MSINTYKISHNQKYFFLLYIHFKMINEKAKEVKYFINCLALAVQPCYLQSCVERYQSELYLSDLFPVRRLRKWKVPQRQPQRFQDRSGPMHKIYEYCTRKRKRGINSNPFSITSIYCFYRQLEKHRRFNYIQIRFFYVHSFP